ncbi:hypothetical protein [Streptomyces sp. NPDC001680]
MGTVAGVAVLVVAWATHALRSKEGVGIVIYLGAGSHWDRIRLREMQQDALRQHAACFVVEPDALLGGIAVSDRVAFAYRVMQARLEEETSGEAGVAESVSFYVTARHQDAYRLGWMLRAQLHDNVAVFAEEAVGSEGADGEDGERQAAGQPRPPRRIAARLMGRSEERGRTVFPAVRLDSSLKRPPTEEDLRLVREMVTAAEAERGKPSWYAFAEPGPAPEPSPEQEPGSVDGTAAGRRPRRIALIVALADNDNLVRDALDAAERGTSPVYAFPAAGGAEGNRCAGALVIRTRPGNIPDTTEHHEALVRYVVHHWRRTVEEQEAEGTCWLFTDGPATFVLALGALLGRRTALVPLAPAGQHRQASEQPQDPEAPRPRSPHVPGGAAR